MSDAYEAHPDSTDQPLAFEDLEGILAVGGKGFVKDQRKVLHFVHRVRVTMQAYQRQIQMLHRDVQATAMAATTQGVPTTLSPLDAVRFLSDEQKATVFDGHLREQLQYVNLLKAEAQKAQEEAVRSMQRMRYTVLSVLEDPAMSDRAKSMLEGLLQDTDPGTEGAA